MKNVYRELPGIKPIRIKLPKTLNDLIKIIGDKAKLKRNELINIGYYFESPADTTAPIEISDEKDYGEALQDTIDSFIYNFNFKNHEKIIKKKSGSVKPEYNNNGSVKPEYNNNSYYHSAKLKEAFNIPYIFDPDSFNPKHNNFFLFKQQLMDHCQSYGIRNEEIVILLLGPKIIKGRAYNLLQVRRTVIKDIKEPDKKLKEIWTALSDSFAGVSKVSEYKENLKNFYQNNHPTQQYYNGFQVKLNVLELEINSRNEEIGSNIYKKMDAIEISDYFISHSSHMAYFIKEILKVKPTQEISWKELQPIIQNKIKEENIIRQYGRQNERNNLQKQRPYQTQYQTQYRGGFRFNNRSRNGYRGGIRGNRGRGGSFNTRGRGYGNDKGNQTRGGFRSGRFRSGRYRGYYGRGGYRGNLNKYSNNNYYNNNRKSFNNLNNNNNDNIKNNQKVHLVDINDSNNNDINNPDINKDIFNSDSNNIVKENGITQKDDIEQNLDDVTGNELKEESHYQQYEDYNEQQQLQQIQQLSIKEPLQQSSTYYDFNYKEPYDSYNECYPDFNDTECYSEIYDDSELYKIEKFADDKYIINDKGGELLDILENVITPELNKKITHELFIWNDKRVLMVFIDSGAGIGVMGVNIFLILYHKYNKPISRKINALAMDKKEVYPLKQKVSIPIKSNYFNIKSGKNNYRIQTIYFYRLDCIEPDMIILGRDGMKALNIGVYARSDIKRIIYFHQRGLMDNILPEDEQINDWFKKIEYRHSGDPGLYLYDKCNNKLEIYNNNNNNNKIKESINGISINGIYDVSLLSMDYNLNEEHRKILRELDYGDVMDSKDQIKIQKYLINNNLLQAFSSHKYDFKTMNVEPFKINIIDESKCKIMRGYDLNENDKKIIRNETSFYINNKIARFQRLGDVVKHAVPCFVVHRKVGTTDDGSIILKSRMVSNFKTLNDNTYPFQYKYITFNELSNHLSQFKYFNASDITKYFYCIPVYTHHQCYMCCVTPDGILLFVVVLHGLKNAPIYGHKITSEIFAKTDIRSVQDDLFGGAATKEECLHNFYRLLSISIKNCIKLSPSKTQLCSKKIDGIGYTITDKGIIPLPRNKTKALSIAWSKILTLRDFKIWEGMVIFLNKFIVSLAGDLKLLTDLIIDRKKMLEIKHSNVLSNKQKCNERLNSKVIKSNEALEVFNGIQHKIECTPLLHHPDLRDNAQHFLLKVDTSGRQTGSSLWQLRGEQVVLVRLYSRALSEQQQNYSATERECLGYVLSINKFSRFLRFEFILIGDHLPMLTLFNINSYTKNRKLIRWVIRLNGYLFVFEHYPGKQLPLEDYLSRLADPTDKVEDYQKDGIVVPVSKEVIDPLINHGIHNINDEFDTSSTNKYDSFIKEYNIELISVDLNVIKTESCINTAIHVWESFDINNICKKINMDQNINTNPNIDSIISIYEQPMDIDPASINNISLLNAIHQNIMNYKHLNGNQILYFVQHYKNKIIENNNYLLQYRDCSTCDINVLTRTKARALELLPKFQPNRAYLLNKEEDNIFLQLFKTKISALQFTGE